MILQKLLIIFGGLLCSAVLAACQPAARTTALPTRAYQTAVTESTATPAPAEPALTAATAAPSVTPAPSRTPSPALLPSASPTQEFTSTVRPIQGPEPLGQLPADDGTEQIAFPAPDDPLESWASLYDPAALQDVQWSEYSGQIDGSQPGSPAGITFRYPAEWVVAGSASTRRITVQNAQVDSGQPQGNNLKLEILHQPARPNISSEQAGDFRTYPVEIAGSPGLLIVYTQDPERTQVLSAIFRHGEAWYIAAGRINLLQPDSARVDRWRAVLFAMFQSIQVIEP